MQNAEGGMLKLFAEDAEFEINVSDSQWCQCRLRHGGNITHLGAESLQYIKGHLLAGLRNEARKFIERYEDHEVSWVLSLAEKHLVLYVTVEVDMLLWQNANAMPICTIKLSPQDRARWIDQLESI
jgi:hypothetical protein